MSVFIDPSLVGLLIQAVGALLFGTLCFILQRTVRREPLTYWAAGWLSLFASLISLFIAFNGVLPPLLLLTIDYAHYAPLFAASSYGLVAPTMPYLAYSPLYDLMFLVMLAFGMVIVTTGEVQHELETVNARLGQTRDRLEAMVQLDHL